MKVTHILADGTKLDNIEGYVIKKEKAREFYNLIARLSKEVKNVKKDI